MHARAVEVGADLRRRRSSSPVHDAEAPGTLIRREAPWSSRTRSAASPTRPHRQGHRPRRSPTAPASPPQLFEPLATAGVSRRHNRPERQRGEADRHDLHRRPDRPRARARDGDAASARGRRLRGGLRPRPRRGQRSSVPACQNTPGYAARMFRTLFEHDINIELISTSEIRITCIVASGRVATPSAPCTRPSPSTSRGRAHPPPPPPPSPSATSRCRRAEPPPSDCPHLLGG